MEGVTPRVSFADLQRMPDDGNRYELYDGELRVVPSPLLRHQIVSQRLLLALVEYANEHGGKVVQPPMDLVLSEYDVVQPDLMYFSPEKAAFLDPADWVRVSPDIAVEVISPSTARHDRVRKRELFERFGVPEYWVVDPDRNRIDVFALSAGRYADALTLDRGLLRSATQAGLHLQLEHLFAPGV